MKLTKQQREALRLKYSGRFRKGTTRIIFLVGKYAIKIPNFTYSMQNFLTGCLANHNERLFCKQFKNLDHISLVAKTYFGCWFGLLNIQERVKPLNVDIKTLPDLRDIFEHICDDYKSENFGLSEITGDIVCIDHG